MKNKKSVVFITALCVFVLALHFVTGPDYSGPIKSILKGYLIDVLLPMSVYLLLQVALRKQYAVSNSRIYAVVLTFFAGLIIENLQFLGYDILGSTWDPLDLVMYLTGIGLGVILDILVIKRWEDQAN